MEDNDEKRRGVWKMKPRPVGLIRRARGRMQGKGFCEDRSSDCICRYGLIFRQQRNVFRVFTLWICEVRGEISIRLTY